MSRYPFLKVETAWQKKWQEGEVFKVKEDQTLPKRYVLEMFPYPSGKIHMGHVRNYMLGDVTARYWRAKGYNILHPMGWDAFGLPAENAAIENGIHPRKWTQQNIQAMKSTLEPLGFSHDWSREVSTCSEEYSLQEQRIFLAFLKSNLVYRKEATVNWDPVEQTVLANEQVVDGKGWRSGVAVERKTLAQWFAAITTFSDSLLESIHDLEEWPARVRIMQQNWIGKSQGALVDFYRTDNANNPIQVFSTRPDTLFGTSFIAIAPNHPIAKQMAENNLETKKFIEECNKIGTGEVELETVERKGIYTNIDVYHPFDLTKVLPVYIGNFIVAEYGTGAVFGCPAHDQRDLEFARRYHLNVMPVVCPDNKDPGQVTIKDQAYIGDGSMINSDFLNGLRVAEAKESAIAALEKQGKGTRKTNYRLRDWGISRQRYWGCPIPIIHCDDCGVVPVSKEDLPVLLPNDIELTGSGNPLDQHPSWKHVSCPQCGLPAHRETDTLDTFFQSAWYFLRFCDPHNHDAPFDKTKIKQWMPVTHYIGGIEHAVLHLLYSRFFMRALKQCEMLDLEEPFKGLFTQGMICHETFQDSKGNWIEPSQVTRKGGQIIHAQTGQTLQVGSSIKMSKSKKNIVNPEDIIASYGADTARLFTMSNSPPDRDLEWSEAGVEGTWRFLNKLWRTSEQIHQQKQNMETNQEKLPSLNFNECHEQTKTLMRKTYQTIIGVEKALKDFHFNVAVAMCHELLHMITTINVGSKKGKNIAEDVVVASFATETLIRLLNPFVPHITEELWKLFGHHDWLINTPWPAIDSTWLEETTKTIIVQVAGKLRAKIVLDKDTDDEGLRKAALQEENVQRAIDGAPIIKTVIISNRLINFVIQK